MSLILTNIHLIKSYLTAKVLIIFRLRKEIRRIFSKRVGNADPFYSNAAKAMEGIKQEKAIRKYKNSNLTIESLNIPTSHTPEATMDLDAVSENYANKNGGELVMLSSNDKVGSLSTPLTE